MTADKPGFPGLVTHIAASTVLGVHNPPPPETCDKIGETGKKTVTLQLFPTVGRLYICGVRGFYQDEKEDDIVFEIQHPLTKEPLFGRKDIPGVALNPEHKVCQELFYGWLYEGQVFVPIHARHVEGAVEPLYCSEDEPLVIVATGTVPVSLAFWGDRRYAVVRYPRPPFGCPPEHLGYFEAAFPHRSIPGLLPKTESTPEKG